MLTEDDQLVCSALHALARCLLPLQLQPEAADAALAASSAASLAAMVSDQEGQPEAVGAADAALSASSVASAAFCSSRYLGPAVGT